MKKHNYKKLIEAGLLFIGIAVAFAGCAKKSGIDSNGKTTTCEKHQDQDNNGFCDNCDENVIVNLDFLVLNDLHGRLLDSNGQPGVDEMTSYIKTMEMTEDNLILLSSGDMWAGSSESNLTHGNIVTDWMNEMNFSSMTLGNHEFDWGDGLIKENLAIAKFPFLAINIYDKTTDKQVDYCQSSVVVEKGGVKIGIIGAIGDCHSSISQDKVGHLYFKTGKELVELIKAEATRLRAEENADFIVLSIHDGSDRGGRGTISNSNLAAYSSVELSSYVDISFEAHTHREYIYTDAVGGIHMQCGGENSYGITHVDVDLNTANGKKVITPENVPHSTYLSWGNDGLINELVAKYDSQIGDVKATVGYNPSYKDGNKLRQLVADLYYDAAIERWGDKYDIVLGGGFISVRGSKQLEEGDVSYSDLQTLFPFDNQLVLCSIRGIDLNNNFFTTRNQNYFICFTDYGEEVRKHIDPNGVYYIVTDTYSSSYEANRLTEIERYDDNVFARDLLVQYFKRK